MSYWKTPKFEETKTYWYSVLAKNGFVDAENTKDLLKEFSFYRGTRCPIALLYIKPIYYELLRDCLLNNPVDSDLDHLILSLKAQGKFIVSICEHLKALGFNRNRHTIGYIIRRYEHRWGIKKWTEKELNPNWKVRHRALIK